VNLFIKQASNLKQSNNFPVTQHEGNAKEMVLKYLNNFTASNSDGTVRTISK
jgi:hypothetical protein